MNGLIAASVLGAVGVLVWLSVMVTADQTTPKRVLRIADVVSMLLVLPLLIRLFTLAVLG